MRIATPTKRSSPLPVYSREAYVAAVNAVSYSQEPESPYSQPLTLDEYQRLAHTTSKQTTIGGDALLYPVLGLSGEAGEVANKVKKIYRDNGGTLDEEQTLMIAKELGGVMWYLTEIATVLGLDLSTVAALNLDKLRSRQDRGVIGGNGDDR